VRKVMRKVMVGMAAVRLRLWLSLWVWLRYITPPIKMSGWVARANYRTRGEARRQTTATHYGRLDARSSNERGRSGRHRDLHRLIAAEGAT
jgi:hypothetical protein